MRPFETLTNRGQARRLRKLAIHALDQYDLKVVDVRLVGVYTNTLFRVRTGGGPSYILRVCTPGWRTATDLLSEATWLQALHRDTDIGAPAPVPARNGDFIVEASAEGVPAPRRCLVMSWIPGLLLASRLMEANLYKMGVLFARLHAHGADFFPPQGFTRRKMDNIYARGEEDVLFACCEASPYGRRSVVAPCSVVAPRTREILDRTLAVVHKAFERLYADPTGLQVIHNDLHHENIKVYRGRLRPFDFEDTIWGYPVQDIAMALQDLMMDVEPDEYDPLQRAFRAGYESRRTWPERYAGQIDTFRAGRMFWVANYVARYEREYFTEHVDWAAQRFERFLETGRLRKA